MSDYFAALATRALQADALRPRPRTRFEPAPVGTSAGPGADATDRGVETGAVNERRAAASLDEGTTSSIARLEHSARALEAAATRTRAAGRARRRTPAVDSPNIVSGDPVGRDPHRLAEAHPTIRIGIESEHAQGERADVASVAEPTRLLRTDTPGSDRMSPPAPPPRAVRTQSRIVRSRAHTESESKPSALDTSEPTIRIHIGRVDVRAIVSPSAEASRRPAEPRPAALMTLDEYVQQRRGTRA